MSLTGKRWICIWRGKMLTVAKVTAKECEYTCKQTPNGWCETYPQNPDRAREGGIQMYDLLSSLGLFFLFFF